MCIEFASDVLIVSKRQFTVLLFSSHCQLSFKNNIHVYLYCKIVLAEGYLYYIKYFNDD